MRLKAAALLRALGACDAPGAGPAAVEDGEQQHQQLQGQQQQPQEQQQQPQEQQQQQEPAVLAKRTSGSGGQGLEASARS